MLSVPLTLAVNQSSQEVTGQDVWGLRVTPRGERSRDLRPPSFFLSQVITQEVHAETQECPASTGNNTVFYEFWPEMFALQLLLLLRDRVFLYCLSVAIISE